MNRKMNFLFSLMILTPLVSPIQGVAEDVQYKEVEKSVQHENTTKESEVKTSNTSEKTSETQSSIHSGNESTSSSKDSSSKSTTSSSSKGSSTSSSKSSTSSNHESSTSTSKSSSSSKEKEKEEKEKKKNEKFEKNPDGNNSHKVDKTLNDKKLEAEMQKSLNQFYIDRWKELQQERSELDLKKADHEEKILSLKTQLESKQSAYDQLIAPFANLLQEKSKLEKDLIKVKHSFYIQLVEKGEIINVGNFLSLSLPNSSIIESELEISRILDVYFLQNPNKESTIQMKYRIDSISAQIALLEEEHQSKIAPFSPQLREVEKAKDALKKQQKEIHALKDEEKAIEKKEREVIEKFANKDKSITDFVFPLKGQHQMVSPFGHRPHEPIKGVGTFHNGTDYVASVGTPLYASMKGVVYHAGYDPISGNCIVLKHPNGYYTYYAHLSVMHVSEGEVVDTLQMIGKTGSTGSSTGPHLHFGMSKAVWSKFVDPVEFVGKTKDEEKGQKLPKLTEEQFETAKNELIAKSN